MNTQNTYIKDCKNQWSMSRPLLGLILINHESFAKVQENLCAQQPADKQAQLSKVSIWLLIMTDKYNTPPLPTTPPGHELEVMVIILVVSDSWGLFT